MKVSFHPDKVRTKEQVQAARRYREVKTLCEHMKELFLSHDGADGDLHRDPDKAAGRFKAGQNGQFEEYVGFASSQGAVDVWDIDHPCDQSSCVSRSEDGSQIRFVRLKRGFSTKNETFDIAADGTVHYLLTESARGTSHFRELTFRDGEVDSAEGVLGAEIREYVDQSLDAVGKTLLVHDQSDTDLNQSDDRIALLDVKFKALDSMGDYHYRRFLSNDIVNEYTKLEKTTEIPNVPKFTGYFAKGGEAEGTIFWSFQPDFSKWETRFSVSRADDRKNGILDVELRRPEWQKNQYFNGSETVLKHIQIERQSLKYSTKSSGLITVTVENTTEQLDASEVTEGDWR